MHDVAAVSGEQSKQGEDELVIPEDPDALLIINMILSTLKLPTIVKQELKEGEESEKEGEKEEGIEESQEQIKESVEEDMSEEVVLDEEDTVDRSEVLKAVEKLQESSKQ